MISMLLLFVFFTVTNTRADVEKVSFLSPSSRRSSNANYRITIKVGSGTNFPIGETSDKHAFLVSIIIQGITKNTSCSSITTSPSWNQELIWEGVTETEATIGFGNCGSGWANPAVSGTVTVTSQTEYEFIHEMWGAYPKVILNMTKQQIEGTIVCSSQGNSWATTNPCGATCFYDEAGDNACRDDCTNLAWQNKDNTNHRCTLKDCTSRSPLPDSYLQSKGQTGWRCGWLGPYPSNCYLDTGAGNTCNTACSKGEWYELNTGVGKGLCELRPCTSRTKISTDTSNPCGTTDCYWDVLDGTNKCSTDCSGGYIKQDSNRTCIQPCTARTKTDTNTNLPCGTADCYWDQGDTSGTNKCNTVCTGSYAKQDSNHTCVPETVEGCSEKTKGEDTFNPCNMANCYWDQGDTTGPNKCSESCTNGAHYTKHPSTLTCVLKTPCSERSPNSTATARCGPDCVLNSGTCTDSCPAHHANNTNGECQIKDCNSRDAVLGNDPCGKNLQIPCYKEGISCLPSCTTPHTPLNSDTGTCELSPCNSRMPTFGSSNWPCRSNGDSCYAINSTKCGASCDLPHTEMGSADVTGRCVVKTCGIRTPYGSGNWRCNITKDEQCYEDVGGTGNCAEECTNKEYELEGTTGKCKIKYCYGLAADICDINEVVISGHGVARCKLTETTPSRCATQCADTSVYESTGLNAKCIPKPCTALTPQKCVLNPECVLTEGTGANERCSMTCTNPSLHEPAENSNKCTLTQCSGREPRSLTVRLKVNRVVFNNAYKNNNNVGITISGVQQNTSTYTTASPGFTKDFTYNNEEEMIFDNIRESDLASMRVQVYVDEIHYIGAATVDIASYKSPTNSKAIITVHTTNITIPAQDQNVTMEIVVCTTCSTSEWPCGQPDEEHKCYDNAGRNISDTSQTGCAFECSNGEHYAKSGNGICILRPCHERAKNSSSTYPCGPDCWWDQKNANTSKCVNSTTDCAADCDQMDSNHTCWQRCAARPDNGSTTWPCGDPTETNKCYANTGRDTSQLGETECATTCSNSAHYISDDSTGRCTEIATCGSRTKNSSETIPCGSGECYWDVLGGTNKCSTDCSDDYIKQDSNHTCVPETAIEQGETVFVAPYPDGVDSEICGPPTNPCATIERAISNSNPGVDPETNEKKIVYVNIIAECNKTTNTFDFPFPLPRYVLVGDSNVKVDEYVFTGIQGMSCECLLVPEENREDFEVCVDSRPQITPQGPIEFDEGDLVFNDVTIVVPDSGSRPGEDDEGLIVCKEGSSIHINGGGIVGDSEKSTEYTLINASGNCNLDLNDIIVSNVRGNGTGALIEACSSTPININGITVENLEINGTFLHVCPNGSAIINGSTINNITLLDNGTVVNSKGSLTINSTGITNVTANENGTIIYGGDGSDTVLNDTDFSSITLKDGDIIDAGGHLSLTDMEAKDVNITGDGSAINACDLGGLSSDSDQSTTLVGFNVMGATLSKDGSLLRVCPGWSVTLNDSVWTSVTANDNATVVDVCGTLTTDHSSFTDITLKDNSTFVGVRDGGKTDLTDNSTVEHLVLEGNSTGFNVEGDLVVEDNSVVMNVVVGGSSSGLFDVSSSGSVVISDSTIEDIKVTYPGGLCFNITSGTVKFAARASFNGAAIDGGVCIEVDGTSAVLVFESGSAISNVGLNGGSRNTTFIEVQNGGHVDIVGAEITNVTSPDTTTLEANNKVVYVGESGTLNLQDTLVSGVNLSHVHSPNEDKKSNSSIVAVGSEGNSHTVVSNVSFAEDPSGAPAVYAQIGNTSQLVIVGGEFMKERLYVELDATLETSADFSQVFVIEDKSKISKATFHTDELSLPFVYLIVVTPDFESLVGGSTHPFQADIFKCGNIPKSTFFVEDIKTGKIVDLESYFCRKACLTTVYVDCIHSSTDFSFCGESPKTACHSIEDAISRLCRDSSTAIPAEFFNERVLFSETCVHNISKPILLDIETHITFDSVSTDGPRRAQWSISQGSDAFFDITYGVIDFTHLEISLPPTLTSSLSENTPYVGVLAKVGPQASLAISHTLVIPTTISESSEEDRTIDYTIVDSKGVLSLSGVNVEGTNKKFTKTLFITNPSFSLNNSSFKDINGILDSNGNPFVAVIHIENYAESEDNGKEINLALEGSLFENINNISSAIYSTVNNRDFTYTLSGLAFHRVSSSGSGSGAAFSHTGGHIHGFVFRNPTDITTSLVAFSEVHAGVLGVGGAIALYGVEKVVIKDNIHFINCTAGKNGAAVFYSAAVIDDDIKISSHVTIEALFENCILSAHTDADPCKDVGAVAVFVQGGMESDVSTSQSTFSGEMSDEFSYGNNNIGFYGGFLNNECK